MSRTRQLALYFVLVFLGTWGIAASMRTGWFGSEGIGNPLFYVAVYVPSVVGISLTAVFEGKAGLLGMIRRLNPLAVRPQWYLIVLVGLPLVAAVGGAALGDRLAFPGIGAALAILAQAIVFDPGPVGEEFGWRGFALPRLLERFSPTVASLILGSAWGLWHLPVLINPAYPQYEMGLARFILGTIGLAIAMTWVHLGTGGSILMSILCHLLINHATELTGAGFPGTALGIGVAAVVVAAIAWRRRPTAA